MGPLLALADVSEDEADLAADKVKADAAALAGDWAAWNREQKRGTKHFAQQHPEGIIIVAARVLQPCVRLLNGVEEVSSHAWVQKQMEACIDGRRTYLTRIEEAVSQQRLETCFLAQETLLLDSRSWLCLPQEYITIKYSSIAFAMVARGMAALQHLEVHPLSGCPALVFTLLWDHAAVHRITSSHACSHDFFTHQFLHRWREHARRTEQTFEAALQSDACRAELFAMACTLRLDILPIECRWAYIRRILKSRPQAPGHSIADASATFLLSRQRVLESLWHSPKPHAPKAKRQAVRKRRSGRFIGHRTGGGGKRRAALSELLKQLNAGGPLSKAERSQRWSDAHRRAEAADVSQQSTWALHGMAGTAAHRNGQSRSFGRKRSSLAVGGAG